MSQEIIDQISQDAVNFRLTFEAARKKYQAIVDSLDASSEQKTEAQLMLRIQDEFIAFRRLLEDLELKV